MKYRLSLPLLSLFLPSCVSKKPFALSPFTEPVPFEYSQGGNVEVRLCRPVLFGFIPLKRGYGMSTLLSAAKDQENTLVDIRIDQRDYFWLLGRTTCHELTAIGATRLITPVPLPETMPRRTEPGPW